MGPKQENPLPEEDNGTKLAEQHEETIPQYTTI